MMSFLPRRTAASLRAPLASSSSARGLATSAVRYDAQAPAQVGPSGDRNLVKEQERRDVHAIEAEVVNDAPAELGQRTVRVYKPAKTANSSGKAGTSFWRVDFDILHGSSRWENPLMGWASSADYMQGTYLKFRTKEDAIHFCEKQNWPYFVQEPHKASIPPKSYASNYDYSSGKLRIHHTK